MSNAAALAVLQPKLEEMERKVYALRQVINELRVEDDMPPLPPSGGDTVSATGKLGSASGVTAKIRPDTFYGKKMQTAIREFLEMRKAQGLGPATPREIYDAITTGGYQFEAKEESVALVGMRALLRKRTAFFHKLPNGTYGLTSWYPDAKPQKSLTGRIGELMETVDETEPETAAPSKKDATAA